MSDSTAPAGYLTDAKQWGCSHYYSGLSKISRIRVLVSTLQRLSLDGSPLETIRVQSRGLWLFTWTCITKILHFQKYSYNTCLKIQIYFYSVQLETMQNISVVHFFAVLTLWCNFFYKDKHFGHALAIMICWVSSSYVAVQLWDDERCKHSTENVEPMLGLQCTVLI